MTSNCKFLSRFTVPLLPRPLNQTQVISQVLEIVSDGVSVEFYKDEAERIDNAQYMLTKLLEVFQE